MSKANQKLQNETVILCEDGDVVITATFNADYYPSQKEEGHGLHETGDMWITTLTNVSITIADKTLPLLHMLTDIQKAAIVRLLQEEHIPHLINLEEA